MRRYRAIIFTLCAALMASCGEGLESEISGDGLSGGGVQFSVDMLTRSAELKEEWVAGDTFAIFSESDQTTSKQYVISSADLTTLIATDSADQFVDSSAGGSYAAFHPYVAGWSYDDYTAAFEQQFCETDYLTSGGFAASTTFTMSHVFAALSFNFKAGYGFSSGLTSFAATLYIGDESTIFNPTMEGTETEVDLDIFIKPGDYSDQLRAISIDAASIEESYQKVMSISTTDNIWYAGDNYTPSDGYFWITLEVLFSDEIFYIYTLEDMLAVGTNSEYVSYSNTMENGDAAVAQDWSLAADYVLMADIDLEGSAENMWTPIGDYYTDNSKIFTGTFDGGGHRLSNLYIFKEEDDSNYGQYQALFGYTSGATIENLIVDGEVTANFYLAGIVAYADDTTISQCGNEANVSLNPNIHNTASGSSGNLNPIYYSYCGGIVGYTESDSEVTSCYNSGDIMAYSTVGGIVGYNKGTLTACYNRGNIYSISIDGGGMIGGIAGFISSGSITNSYSAGGVTYYYDGSTVQYIGAIAGYQGVTPTGCYYDSDNISDGYLQLTDNLGVTYTFNTHTLTTTTGGTSYTTDQMTGGTLLGNLGTTYWKEDTNRDNDGYPILVWQ